MQHVDVKVHGSLATIMMDRPQCRNALGPQMIADLRLALSDIHQEKRVGAVLLTGAGDHFCSGVDLKVFAEIAEMPEQDALSEWLSIWRQLTELLEEMLRFPKPIVAAVDGAAVGAGLALVLAADLLVMSDRGTLSASAAPRVGWRRDRGALVLSIRCRDRRENDLGGRDVQCPGSPPAGYVPTARIAATDLGGRFTARRAMHLRTARGSASYQTSLERKHR